MNIDKLQMAAKRLRWAVLDFLGVPLVKTVDLQNILGNVKGMECNRIPRPETKIAPHEGKENIMRRSTFQAWQEQVGRTEFEELYQAFRTEAPRAKDDELLQDLIFIGERICREKGLELKAVEEVN